MSGLALIDWARIVLPIAVGIGIYELLFVVPLRLRSARLRRRQAEFADLLHTLQRRSLETERRERTALERFRLLGERLGQMELRSESRSYEQAIDLAARGGPVEQLASCFGLTEGEANLVRLLHGRRDRGERHP